MEGILIGLAAAFMLGGFFAYNGVRKKYAGIMGVPGAYFILLSIMLLVGLISGIFTGNFGTESMVEMIASIVIMLLGLLYMAYVMAVRCETVMQRVMLPIAACVIGFGFCWRLLAAIAFHAPMENGKSQEAADFPKVLYDPQENRYELLSESGDHADYYCHKTGGRAQFYRSDLADGVPNGWRRG